MKLTFIDGVALTFFLPTAQWPAREHLHSSIVFALGV